jgi:aminodeoxyfutalosine deaminase
VEHVCIQADYVVVSPTQILRPGFVIVRHGRIAQVGAGLRQADVRLGPVALLPGLINSHTHLEFSCLDQPFPAGENFPSWISSVLAWRRQMEGKLDEAQWLESRRAAWMAGRDECWRNGTCLIADIVTPPWSSDWLRYSSDVERSELRPDAVTSTAVAAHLLEHLAAVRCPRVIPFPEVLGHDRQRFETLLSWAEGVATADRQQAGNCETWPNGWPSSQGFGISPHAPYSLRWNADSRLALRAAIQRSPLAAMHVAESPAELAWVESGTGAFSAFFERLGIETTTERLQFRDAIELLELAPRGLLVHGYYLPPQWIARSAQSGRLAWVYCPRTCQHFGHKPLDLDFIAAQGIPVIIGSDSRASNPDLSIWRELCALRSLHPRISAEQALAMATTTAAQGLGVSEDYGSLETGKLAFINVQPVSGSIPAQSLLEQLLPAQHLGTSTTSAAAPVPLSKFLAGGNGIL